MKYDLVEMSELGDTELDLEQEEEEVEGEQWEEVIGVDIKTKLHLFFLKGRIQKNKNPFKTVTINFVDILLHF